MKLSFTFHYIVTAFSSNIRRTIQRQDRNAEDLTRATSSQLVESCHSRSHTTERSIRQLTRGHEDNRTPKQSLFEFKNFLSNYSKLFFCKGSVFQETMKHSIHRGEFCRVSWHPYIFIILPLAVYTRIPNK